MKVLSLCDYTGNMVKPWAEAGHDCYIVDIQHPAWLNDFGANITSIGMDLITQELPLSLPEMDIVFAAPPCTDLASSGARWFKNKGLKKFIEALQMVETCLEIAERYNCPYMIENPVGRLASWR